MAVLYDRQGKPVEVPDDQVAAALSSGQLGVPEGTRISVKHPDGRIGAIPVEQAPAAFASGYRYYGDSDRAADAEKAKYEGVVPGAEAALAGAARGATFGASDVGLRALGTKAETLRKLKEHNPLVSTGSEILGAAAPMLLAPEAAPEAEALAGGAEAAEGAAAAAPSLLSRAAAAAPTSVVSGIGDAAAEAVGGGMAGNLARGAAEGAFYGAGQELSDDALGDRQVSAERLLAAAGIGATGGALLSGALSLGAAGLKRGVSAVAERIGASDLPAAARKSAEDWAIESIDPTLGNLKGMTRSGKINTVGRDLLTPKIGEEELPGVVKAGASAEEMLGRLQVVKQRAGEVIGSSLDELDAKAAANPEAAGALFSPAKIAARIEEEVFAKLPAGGAFDRDVINKIETTITGPLYEMSEKDPFRQLTLAEANSFKSRWNQKLNDWTREQSPGAELIKDATSVLQRSIDGAAEKVAEKTGSPETFQAFKDAKRVYGSMATAEGPLQNKVNKALAHRAFGLIGNLGLQGGGAALFAGHPIAAAGLAGGALFDKFARERGATVMATGLDQLAKTDMLANIGNAVARKIGESASAVGKVGKYSIPSAASVLDSLHFGHDAAYASAPRDAGEAYQRRRDELLSLTRNPAKMGWLTEQRVAGLRSVVPQHADAMKQQHQTALSFLASKLPQQGSSTGKSLPPSTAEVQTFAAYVHAVDKPLEALDAAMAGKASPESAEALRAVYPTLFAAMKAQAIHAIQTAEKPPEYAQVVSLSQFFGEPLDETMQPSFIRSMQQASGADHEKAGKPRAIPKGQMKSIQQGATESQRIEGR